jgi:hypothetical protein
LQEFGLQPRRTTGEVTRLEEEVRLRCHASQEREEQRAGP